MKPLNLDNRPCSPISSNCVVWQGPTLDCINLCTGDTISDVVAKLATELCTILDQTNVTNYDLTCLGITACGPKDFQALIQLLIDKICELNGVTPDTTKSSECPDCIVSVASCFAQNGTTMQLLDYVQMIGEKVCALIDEIANLQTQIDDLDIRVTILENTPPPTFTLPSIDTNCLASYMSGQVSATIDLVLDTLLNDPTIGYCALIGATGLPSDLLSAVAKACITSSTPTLSNPPVPFGTEYLGTWVNSPTTVADAITNIWIALCDIYDYLTSGGAITVTDTNTVNLTYTSGTLQADVQDTGWVDVLGFDFMSANSSRPQCRRIGNQIIFRGVIQVPMGNAGNGESGSAYPAASPDAYRSYAFGRTLNSTLSGDLSACAINGSNPTGTIPSGSTNINEGIAIHFNRGLRCIPSSVLPSGINLDGSSTSGNRQLIFRNIDIIGTESVYLSSIATVFITSNGILGITSPYNNENYSGSGIEYSSMQRNIVSNIIAGENIPLYDPTAPSLNNATGAVTYNPDVIGSARTWPFTMNCMSAFQLGGFSIRIDGLIGYIDPCETLIPTPAPCE